MKKSKLQTVYKVIMLIVVASVITYALTNIFSYDNSRKYVVSSSKDTNIVDKMETSIGAIKNILDEKYLGELDEEALMNGALKGMVAATGDIYTEYYTAKELSEFTASTLGNFVGIGVYMQADEESGRVTVISPIAGSPADKAGIKPGDKIIKVDGVEYKAEDINEVSSHVKGEIGTEVTITIERDGELIDLTIKRENIHINYVDGKIIDDNIGYIQLSTFDVGCYKDFLETYNKLHDERSKRTYH